LREKFLCRRFIHSANSQSKIIDLSVDELPFRWLRVAVVSGLKPAPCHRPFFTSSQADGGDDRSPDAALAAEKLPECHYILVSHPHYDHLMDAPAIALNTGAGLYGSANTCRIASLSGVPDEQIHEVSPGELLHLGEFEVQFLGTEHMRTPVDQWLNER
jgi:hypothetical protein